MATTKKRINISVGPKTEKAIRQLARRDSVPQATKAAMLIRTALELEEDIIFDKIATERYKTKGKTLSHKELWK